MTPRDQRSGDDRQSPTPDAAGPTGFPMNLWHRALGCSDVRPADARVAHHMATYATYATGRDIRPGLDRLAQELTGDGRNKGNISRSIARLVEAGWLIVTRKPSKGRGSAAVYRLGFGEFRRFDGDEKVVAWITFQGSGGGRKVVTDAEKVVIQDGKGCHPDNPPLSTSQDLSFSSAATEPSEPPAPARREEEERRSTDDEPPASTGDALADVLAFWPNKRIRGAQARENTRDALDDLLGRGIALDAILRAIHAGKHDGSITPESWFDSWARTAGDTITAGARRAAADARKAATADCTLCDEHAFVELPAEPGSFNLTTTARCTHDADAAARAVRVVDDRRAAHGDAWAEVDRYGTWAALRARAVAILGHDPNPPTRRMSEREQRLDGLRRLAAEQAAAERAAAERAATGPRSRQQADRDRRQDLWASRSRAEAAAEQAATVAEDTAATVDRVMRDLAS